MGEKALKKQPVSAIDEFKSSNAVAEDIRTNVSKELVIAICGAIGSGFRLVYEQLELALRECDYTVKRVRISNLFAERTFEPHPNKDALACLRGCERIKAFQDLGDDLRKKHGTSIAAELAIHEINILRQQKSGEDGPSYERTAYIIDSLKHPDERNMLELVYPNNFFQIGIFRKDAQRISNLKDEGIKEDEIANLISRDKKNEVDSWGQQVEKVFKSSDYFIENDLNNNQQVINKLLRFIGLIHGSPIHTPKSTEIGMFAAYAASLQSACLSRQVGAAILDEKGNIIATGCNDAPRFGGGLYKSGDGPDHRCVFRGGKCYNDHEKKKLGKDIQDRLIKEGIKPERAEKLVGELFKSTRLGSLIEFSRAIHAEMDALISLSRSSSNSTVGCSLYTTTYPCHNCARHIVAAGIKEVYYIEPYEKSMATHLHDDAISNVNENEKVSFKSYEGVAPRKYAAWFRASKDRKDSNGIAIMTRLSESGQIELQLLNAFRTYEDYISQQVTKKFDQTYDDSAIKE